MKFWIEFQKFELLNSIGIGVGDNHRNRRGMMMHQQPVVVAAREQVSSNGLHRIKAITLKGSKLLIKKSG
jgi:hypothetical protein